ncbi:Tolloid-like protein 2 [Bulinus truncatus]|nr:Tolloid-like protein 2 [Bulinus truncatus]
MKIYKNLLAFYVVTVLVAEVNSCQVQNGVASGFISTPNYPGSYPSDANCVWKIDIPLGIITSLISETFELETGMTIENVTQCSFDVLKVLNVEKKTEMSFCGDKQINYWSNSATLILIFISDTSETKSGFKIRYTFENSFNEPIANVSQCCSTLVPYDQVESIESATTTIPKSPNTTTSKTVESTSTTTSKTVESTSTITSRTVESTFTILKSVPGSTDTSTPIESTTPSAIIVTTLVHPSTILNITYKDFDTRSFGMGVGVGIAVMLAAGSATIFIRCLIRRGQSKNSRRSAPEEAYSQTFEYIRHEFTGLPVRVVELDRNETTFPTTPCRNANTPTNHDTEGQTANIPTNPFTEDHNANLQTNPIKDGQYVNIPTGTAPEGQYVNIPEYVDIKEL